MEASVRTVKGDCGTVSTSVTFPVLRGLHPRNRRTSLLPPFTLESRRAASSHEPSAILKPKIHIHDRVYNGTRTCTELPTTAMYIHLCLGLRLPSLSFSGREMVQPRGTKRQHPLRDMRSDNGTSKRSSPTWGTRIPCLSIKRNEEEGKTCIFRMRGVIQNPHFVPQRAHSLETDISEIPNDHQEPRKQGKFEIHPPSPNLARTAYSSEKWILDEKLPHRRKLMTTKPVPKTTNCMRSNKL